MNIFQDLQIDYSNMMNDPQEFHASCVREAEKLRDILKADISPESVLKDILSNETPSAREDEYIKAEIEALYKESDDGMSVPALLKFAEQLRRLAKDIEYLARDKVLLRISKDNEGSIDKALAFELYKELRTRHNDWVDGMEMLARFDPDMKGKLEDVHKLAALPGNYSRGPQNLAHYIFRIDGDEDIFRMPHGVFYELRKRGVLPADFDCTKPNMMDAVEMFKNDFSSENPVYKVHVTEREV